MQIYLCFSGHCGIAVMNWFSWYKIPIIQEIFWIYRFKRIYAKNIITKVHTYHKEKDHLFRIPALGQYRIKCLYNDAIKLRFSSDEAKVVNSGSQMLPLINSSWAEVAVFCVSIKKL